MSFNFFEDSSNHLARAKNTCLPVCVIKGPNRQWRAKNDFKILQLNGGEASLYLCSHCELAFCAIISIQEELYSYVVIYVNDYIYSGSVCLNPEYC